MFYDRYLLESCNALCIASILFWSFLSNIRIFLVVPIGLAIMEGVEKYRAVWWRWCDATSNIMGYDELAGTIIETRPRLCDVRCDGMFSAAECT